MALRDALAKIETIHEEDKKLGRPSFYRPEYAAIATELCENGATDHELSIAFSVTTRTISRWKIAHADFSLALKTAKDIADERVEMTLYHRAVGYSFEAVKIMQHEGKAVVYEYVEHIPPDTTAMIFWLKNRRPDRWRDKHEVEHSGSVGLGDRLARAKAREGQK
jgi:hypothetical protein